MLALRLQNGWSAHSSSSELRGGAERLALNTTSNTREAADNKEPLMDAAHEHACLPTSALYSSNLRVPRQITTASSS